MRDHRSAHCESTPPLHGGIRTVSLRIESTAGSHGTTLRPRQMCLDRVRLCSVGEMNRGGHAGLVPDDACGVPFSCEVFCQVHMAWTEAVHAAISEADLHFALQSNDELPAWSGVPIAKMTRLRGPKDDALRGH